MPSKSISGLAVGVMAAGGLIVWSGLNNAGLIESLQALARGEAPPKHPKPPWKPITGGDYAEGGGTFPGFGNDIVAEAEKWVGKSPYVYGGCHGCTPCAPGQGVDCSSFVTWVMYRTGHYKGKCSMVAGSSMAAWGRRVSWDQRQPGDVALWYGKHCAIITGATTTIEAACTACGPVRHGTYGKSHNGIATMILRAPDMMGAGPPASREGSKDTIIGR